jgi:hypothetical protein
MKYRPEFPERFGCSEDSRSFCRNFFGWYNTEHYHSGIGFLTPEDVHYGRAEQIIKERQTVLKDAFAKHPERFKGNAENQRLCQRQPGLINRYQKIVILCDTKFLMEVSHFH